MTGLLSKATKFYVASRRSHTPALVKDLLIENEKLCQFLKFSLRKKVLAVYVNLKIGVHEKKNQRCAEQLTQFSKFQSFRSTYSCMCRLESNVNKRYS